MKLIIDDNIVIFLDKAYLQNFDLTNQNLIEKKLIKLINKIQNKYTVDLNGYYNVNKIQNKYTVDLNGYYNVYIHKDTNYGLIVDMQKEDLEYIDYFNNQLELNIEVVEDSFLYKIEDIFTINKHLLNKFIIYKNGYMFYLKPKENLSNIELGIILENAEIIYGKEAKTIKNKSQIIKV